MGWPDPTPLQRRIARRAALFFVGIGLPVLATLWLQLTAGILLAAITGLMFSFADDEGSLVPRFTALVWTAGGICVGGAIGHLLDRYGPIFWLLFVAGAFAAAWLNRTGKAAHIGARVGVMALTIAAGTPQLSRTEVALVSGSLAVVVLSRLVDHALFGPLPAIVQPVVRAAPENDRLWLRYAAAYTVAAMAGLWLGLMLDPQHAIWVVVTTLVVMQPDRSNYRRILERIVGTLFGVVAAFLVTRVGSVPLTIAGMLAASAFLPHHIPVRYWLHTAVIAFLVMLAYDLASPGLPGGAELGSGLFTERIIDVLIGCALAFAGTEVGFHWGRPIPRADAPR